MALSESEINKLVNYDGRNALLNITNWADNKANKKGGTIHQMIAAIEAEGIQLKKVLGTGTSVVAFEDERGNVIRLEDKDASPGEMPLNHPIVMKAFEDKEIKVGDKNLRIRTVLKGEEPDTLGVEDVLRTAAVLHKLGKLGHWKDVDHTQLKYVRGKDGEYLKYPDGHPIAFIGDMNSIPEDEEAAKRLITKGVNYYLLRTPDKFTRKELQRMKAEAFAKVTDADVKACEQQYDLITEAQKVLGPHTAEAIGPREGWVKGA